MDFNGLPNTNSFDKIVFDAANSLTSPNELPILVCPIIGINQLIRGRGVQTSAS